MSVTLQVESEELFAGASWSWEEDLSDYPASEYDLAMYVKKSSASPTGLDVAKSSDTFLLTKSANDTGALANGDYHLQAIFTKLSDSTISVVKKVIHIYSLITQSGDVRTYWEIELEYLQTLLTKLDQKTADEVTYNGRTYRYKDRSELLKAINLAEEKIEDERTGDDGRGSILAIMQ